MDIVQFHLVTQRNQAWQKSVWTACEKKEARRKPDRARMPARVHRHKSAEQPSPAAGSHPTVLVVDHAPMLRKAITAVLQKLGYQTLEASGAVEARRLAARHKKIDLLLVDFSIPESNGLELVRWFQTLFPKTKALITTDSLWEFMYQTGNLKQYVVLPKPFSDVELGQVLERTLR
jgi:CheY-like chemotaxis protein